MNPYSVPHYAEREAAHLAMMRLDRMQQAVLRSYVVQVYYGDMTLTAWHGSEHGVNRATWQKPRRKGGRYYGTEDDGNPEFREALEKLIDCYGRERTAAEARAVALATQEYRLAANSAAQTHIQLMLRAEKEEVRLAAANQVADRAGVTAPKKVEMRVDNQTVRTYSVIAHPGQWDEDDEPGA